jgi:DNA-binding response OmpR family regulator
MIDAKKTVLDSRGNDPEFDGFSQIQAMSPDRTIPNSTATAEFGSCPRTDRKPKRSSSNDPQTGPVEPRPDIRPRVLIIEDDRDIVEAISYHLDKHGFAIRVARTGEEGLDAVRRGVDLVLLDLNLPCMDGLEVCRMIRRQTTTAHVPIIIISARGDEVDRVLGLEMGADDYLVKPFSLKELSARCRSALRRTGSDAPSVQGYRDENFEIEFDDYLVRYQGQELRLTHKEFDLFRHLVERAGRVITRERLLERVWGYDTEIDPRSIDAHIRRLRHKLGPARRHIETLVGLGYRFVK